MSFGSSLYEHLSGGLSVGDRVYPSRLPQGIDLSEGPVITWQLIPSEGPLVTHAGDTGLTTVRVQFDCWGATFDASEALADELRDLISGVAGTWGDVQVGHCLLDSGLDDDDERTGAHRRIVDALIQYREDPDGS